VAGVEENAQYDPFNVRYDKALSTLNYPHRVVASVVLAPHGAWSNAVVRWMANGWTLAPIFTETSGRPYSYEIRGGTYLNGGYESINGSGGADYLPTVGRNTLRLPARGRVDLRLAREIKLDRGMHLTAFAEAFNLFNAENISSVETRAFQLGTSATIGNTTATGPTPLLFQDAAEIATEGLTTEVPFGTPNSSTTGTSKERQVELGLRLQF
jgi:hypothetical protein